MMTCRYESREPSARPRCRVCAKQPPAPDQPVYLWHAFSGWAAARGICDLHARANLLRGDYIVRRFSDREAALAAIEAEHPGAKIIVD